MHARTQDQLIRHLAASCRNFRAARNRRVEPLLRGKSSLIDQPDQHWLYIVGRLRPGAKPEAVEAKINVELKQWWMSQPLPPETTTPLEPSTHDEGRTPLAN